MAEIPHYSFTPEDLMRLQRENKGEYELLRHQLKVDYSRPILPRNVSDMVKQVHPESGDELISEEPFTFRRNGTVYHWYENNIFAGSEDEKIARQLTYRIYKSKHSTTVFNLIAREELQFADQPDDEVVVWTYNYEEQAGATALMKAEVGLHRCSKEGITHPIGKTITIDLSDIPPHAVTSGFPKSSVR